MGLELPLAMPLDPLLRGEKRLPPTTRRNLETRAPCLFPRVENGHVPASDFHPRRTRPLLELLLPRVKAPPQRHKLRHIRILTRPIPHRAHLRRAPQRKRRVERRLRRAHARVLGRPLRRVGERDLGGRGEARAEELVVAGGAGARGARAALLVQREPCALRPRVLLIREDRVHVLLPGTRIRRFPHPASAHRVRLPPLGTLRAIARNRAERHIGLLEAAAESSSLWDRGPQRLLVAIHDEKTQLVA
mmetsp:Transcript_56529/g.134298  ORF Transcript_56529/g.134298 Transcript_56529/m.134298 type:complete len:247 (-) Transcript_56529:626-1366(-)